MKILFCLSFLILSFSNEAFGKDIAINTDFNFEDVDIALQYNKTTDDKGKPKVGINISLQERENNTVTNNSTCLTGLKASKHHHHGKDANRIPFKNEFKSHGKKEGHHHDGSKDANRIPFKKQFKSHGKEEGHFKNELESSRPLRHHHQRGNDKKMELRHSEKRLPKLKSAGEKSDLEAKIVPRPQPPRTTSSPTTSQPGHKKEPKTSPKSAPVAQPQPLSQVVKQIAKKAEKPNPQKNAPVAQPQPLAQAVKQIVKKAEKPSPQKNAPVAQVPPLAQPQPLAKAVKQILKKAENPQPEQKALPVKSANAEPKTSDKKPAKIILKSSRFEAPFKTGDLSAPFLGLETKFSSGQNESDCDSLFAQFKSQYAKKYNNDAEEKAAKENFCKTLGMVKEHNKRFAQGLVSSKLTIYGYGDHTFEAFQGIRTGFQYTKNVTANTLEAFKSKFKSLFTKANKKAEIPAECDYSSQLCDVPDQGACGSCWSFSATAPIEWKLKKLHNYTCQNLSEQQLVDCSSNSNGCGGGLPMLVYKFLTRTGKGITTSQSYPYASGQTMVSGSCRKNFANENYKIQSYYSTYTLTAVTKLSEDQIKAVLIKNGPVSIAIYAGDTLKTYKGGIHKDPACLTNDPNHAVFLVGYGTTPDGQNYWKIRNSWGPTWGEQGYFRMYRGADNQCHVDSYLSFPVIKA